MAVVKVISKQYHNESINQSNRQVTTSTDYLS